MTKRDIQLLESEVARLRAEVTARETEIGLLKLQWSFRVLRRLEVSVADRVVLDADLVPTMRKAYGEALLSALEYAVEHDVPARITIRREDGRIARAMFYLS